VTAALPSDVRKVFDLPEGAVSSGAPPLEFGGSLNLSGDGLINIAKLGGAAPKFFSSLMEGQRPAHRAVRDEDVVESLTALLPANANS
jgi:hypothetical protein